MTKALGSKTFMRKRSTSRSYMLRLATVGFVRVASAVRSPERTDWVTLRHSLCDCGSSLSHSVMLRADLPVQSAIAFLGRICAVSQPAGEQPLSEAY